MNSNIKYLKDENGNVISPVTSTDSIFSSSGTSLLDFFYPVGTYYETSNTSFDPNVSWGGTWKRDTQGLTTIAGWIYGSETFPTKTSTSSSEESDWVNIYVGVVDGEETHTLTTSEMPTHSHNMHYGPGTVSGTAVTYPGNQTTYYGYSGIVANTGGGQAHNNVQPSIGVMRWHRTA